MYLYKLYPTHMWYKHLASIRAASGSLTKLAFLQKSRIARMFSKTKLETSSMGARAPGPATYKIKHNVVRGRPWGPCSSRVSALVAVASESHRFCPCFWGRSHPWFFAEKTTVNCEPPKVEPCLAGSDFSPGSEGNSQARFDVNSSLATRPELGIPRYPNYISLEAGWMGQVGWFQGE